MTLASNWLTLTKRWTPRLLTQESRNFWAFLEAYEPGKTAAEVLAPAERLFVEQGCGRLTMNMVLVGPEFAIARSDVVLGDFCIPSLEIAGPGGHWVEVSRAIGHAGGEVQGMLDAYVRFHLGTMAAMQLISMKDFPGRPATATVVRAGPPLGKYVLKILFIGS